MNFDGDGSGDLAVGLPGENGHGAVQVMFGAHYADDFERGNVCNWDFPLCL